MTRREVLRYTALMVGGTVAAPVATSLLSGCQPTTTKTPFVPKFFNTQQFEFIKDISSTILPNGEIPGALEVGVHQVIDHMVGVVFSREDQNRYLKGLHFLMNMFSAKTAPEQFSKLSAENKSKWILEFESQLKAEQSDDYRNIDVKSIALMNEAGEERPLNIPEEKALRRETYLQLKQQTIAYFLSSEEIGMNHLNYLPVPGKYEACISLESVGGKAWAI